MQREDKILNNDRIPKPSEIYNHFKNKLYQIITVAIHSETREKMVVYQALYGDFKTYVRPLEMFISEVDRNKYPEVEQKYRFELVIRGEVEQEEKVVQEEKVEQEEKFIDLENLNKSNILINDKKEKDSIIVGTRVASNDRSEGEVNPVLIEFLDANSYEEKIVILSSKIKHIDDRLLDAMAVSLDCTVEEGAIEDRIEGLMFCLRTLARFESNRLR